MGQTRFITLADQFVGVLERSSATVIRESRTNVRPARISVINGSGQTDCFLFLWSITPGGKKRPANERRIQMTKISGMPLKVGWRTLLGGWSDEYKVYAFWDARRHTSFTEGSPSLQVDAQTLETASHVGIASQPRPSREGMEVVIAVNPETLLWYVQNGESLHNADEDATGIADLAEASPEEEQNFIDNSTSESSTVRRVDLVKLMKLFRDARFRPAVLQAFGYRCCVCNCDLKLVEAAHIVPVSHPKSTDEVTNGLALCRLHHGAFDNALLGVQSNYKIIINPESEERLKSIKLDVGLNDFKARLQESIRLPASIEARPDPGRLKLGLEIRRWPTGYVV